MRVDVCRIERPFARTLNGQIPPRYSLWIPVLPGTTLVLRVPLWIPACAGMTLGRASAVWLAFVGGAGICSASEPYSYNGLRDRVSAAFRPAFQTSLRLVAGTAGGSVCWRLRVVPLAACLPLFSCRFFCLASEGCAFPGRGDVSFFRSADPMISGSALVVYITTYVVGVKCLNPDYEGLVGFCGCVNPLRLASLRVPLLLTQKGEGGLSQPFCPISPSPCPSPI